VIQNMRDIFFLVKSVNFTQNEELEIDGFRVSRFLHLDVREFPMKNMVKSIGIVSAFAAFVSVLPAMASQSTPPAAQPERQKDPAPITGELLALDSEAKSFTVKTDADAEMKFSYTEETEIVGADKGTSGLATMSGAAVTVHYTFHGTANTATKIEVKPKQQAR
jgi:hypothetical protein